MSFLHECISVALFLNQNEIVIISLQIVFVLLCFTVRSGYSVIPMALASDLDIKFNTAVKQIRYSSSGVEIQTVPTNNRSPNAGPCTYTGISRTKRI